MPIYRLSIIFLIIFSNNWQNSDFATKKDATESAKSCFKKMQKWVKEAQHPHGQKARNGICSHIFLWNVSLAFNELIGPNLLHFPISIIFWLFQNFSFSISIILPIIWLIPIFRHSLIFSDILLTPRHLSQTAFLFGKCENCNC